MSGFYFSGDSGSISSADDEDNLPYPEALPRSDFLAPSFDAPTYLSTLADRHQTLEDLRSDLRERSQALSKELLDLVNTNYEQFLSLGSDLRGGEEKVEDLRVGLLGFKRGIEDVKVKIRQRGMETEGLLDEKLRISKQVSDGRRLMEMEARLEELEERLVVESTGRNGTEVGDSAWSDSDDEDEVENISESRDITATNTRKLQRLVQDYRYVEHLSNSAGSHHPFVVAMQARVIRVRNTLLLDLSTVLKSAARPNETSSPQLLAIMAIYREMGEGGEAVKMLKSLTT